MKRAGASQHRRRAASPSSSSRPCWRMKPDATGCTGWTVVSSEAAVRSTTGATPKPVVTNGRGGRSGPAGRAIHATRKSCGASIWRQKSNTAGRGPIHAEVAVTRHRVAGAVIGVVTFVAAHLMLVAKWTSWFHGQHEPWFLNTASAGEFTVACVFGVSLVAGVFSASGLFLWLGAIAAMIGVMLLPPGPGTLWPIAMAIGGAVLAVAILSGNMLGLGIRHLAMRVAADRRG